LEFNNAFIATIIILALFGFLILKSVFLLKTETPAIKKHITWLICLILGIFIIREFVLINPALLDPSIPSRKLVSPDYLKLILNTFGDFGLAFLIVVVTTLAVGRPLRDEEEKNHERRIAEHDNSLMKAIFKLTSHERVVNAVLEKIFKNEILIQSAELKIIVSKINAAEYCFTGIWEYELVNKTADKLKLPLNFSLTNDVKVGNDILESISVLTSEGAIVKEFAKDELIKYIKATGETFKEWQLPDIEFDDKPIKVVMLYTQYISEGRYYGIQRVFRPCLKLKASITCESNVDLEFEIESLHYSNVQSKRVGRTVELSINSPLFPHNGVVYRWHKVKTEA